MNERSTVHGHTPSVAKQPTFAITLTDWEERERIIDFARAHSYSVSGLVRIAIADFIRQTEEVEAIIRRETGQTAPTSEIEE